MNKKVTIIPSTVSLQKAIGTNKEIYNCLGIFPTITDLRKFEFLKSTVSLYKAFEMVGNIYCEDYNNCPKSKFIQLIKKSKVNIVICNSKNDINLENVDIPIYCLNESIVINKGKTIKLS